MFTTDEFVLSINSCWNAASDNLFLCGVRINPPMLKRRSTGAEVTQNDFLFKSKDQKSKITCEMIQNQNQKSQE